MRKAVENNLYLTDSDRGIDPTLLPANDCGRIQNAPLAQKIPSWWLEAGTKKQIREWKRQLKSGEAELE